MFEDIERYCKVHDLCVNRVKVINEVTEDAARIRCARGTYTVTLWGRAIATWGGCDLSAVERAYQRLDAVFDVLWDARRVGMLSPVV